MILPGSGRIQKLFIGGGWRTILSLDSLSLI